MIEVRTRFAPSPTGDLHLGHLRTALYSYAMAKSSNGLPAGRQGKFLLRIEDTDRNRFVSGSTEKIYEILKKFGLNWDEGPLVGGPDEPYIQSERTALGIYQKYADQLIKQGNAYYCFCQRQTVEERESEYDKGQIKLRDSCRDLTAKESAEKIAKGIKPAVRLRVPDKGEISFIDFITKKEIKWETRFVDEVMLLKSDGFPTYHLAAVVDDFLMKISHVIRGHGWFPSTPAHLLLMDYLGFPRPEICHLTDILEPEGGKLSKRKGSVSSEDFLKEGYLPEALLNFVMLIGWAPKDNREIFSLQEFVDNFQKGQLQIANPVFNRVKLDWFNGYYIRKTKDEKLKTLINKFYEGRYPEDKIGKIIPIIKDRIVKLSDFSALAGFFFKKPSVDKALFKDLLYEEHLKAASEVLGNLSNWTNEKIQESLTKLIEEKKWKTEDFYMSLRIALTGSRFTPPITQSAEILGKKETLSRLKI
ncbi:glutamate--tRNA ligase [Candidatus Shapirobacteria bacterium CG03_land_8_20_14_0_80_39_12]|uniref:Glutamate--tRNA ligase n=1 Tax=Candidatus Shapirobacteria bacterium CG03_land_8_20_14_0_80_39_12 TaxID=1974879 RepID=A0A2M7BC79_9BACT|nr:MAG: glutamate--tRNA ligase [Candidatus Shapirobacteria bacterium CG03_land_8_20_14_0_80_39_12]